MFSPCENFYNIQQSWKRRLFLLHYVLVFRHYIDETVKNIKIKFKGPFRDSKTGRFTENTFKKMDKIKSKTGTLVKDNKYDVFYQQSMRKQYNLLKDSAEADNILDSINTVLKGTGMRGGFKTVWDSFKNFFFR